MPGSSDDGYGIHWYPYLPSITGTFGLKINNIAYGFTSIYFNYDFNTAFIDSTEESVILPEDLFNNLTKAI